MKSLNDVWTWIVINLGLAWGWITTNYQTHQIEFWTIGIVLITAIIIYKIVKSNNGSKVETTTEELPVKYVKNNTVNNTYTFN